ncbi:hypothetical protein EON73_03795 [bacterium]|nr:MAG: hypothetical protein EON73_03795 [bacterium]
MALFIPPKKIFTLFPERKTLFPESDGTFKVPNTWETNTVLFFAIQTMSDVDMTVRLFTETKTEGHISYDFARDEVNLSDSLLPSKAKRNPFIKQPIPMNSRISQEIEAARTTTSEPVSTLRSFGMVG